MNTVGGNYVPLLIEVAQVDPVAKIDGKFVIDWAIDEGIDSDNIGNFIESGFFYSTIDEKFIKYLVNISIEKKQEHDEKVKAKIIKKDENYTNWVIQLLEKDSDLKKHFIHEIISPLTGLNILD